MAQGGGESWIHQAIEAATVALGLGTAVTAYVQGRKHERAAFVTAIQKAAHLVITDLRAECERLKVTNDQSRLEHEQCRAELAAIRRQIDQLMRENPPASY